MISSLKFLHSRRLRLAAIAHIYPILPYITCCSYLLARTTRVGVTILQAEPLGDLSSITRHHAIRDASETTTYSSPDGRARQVNRRTSRRFALENLDAEEERLQRLVAEKENTGNTRLRVKRISRLLAVKTSRKSSWRLHI
jgi:hypothetical protein